MRGKPRRRLTWNRLSADALGLFLRSLAACWLLSIASLRQPLQDGVATLSITLPAPYLTRCNNPISLTPMA